MGRRQFYLWVAQALKERGQHTADDPERWEGTESDEWWQSARRRRDEALGR